MAITAVNSQYSTYSANDYNSSFDNTQKDKNIQDTANEESTSFKNYDSYERSDTKDSSTIENNEVSFKVTKTGGSKSFLQKMREKAEEIRLKNLRKKAQAEKREAAIAKKRSQMYARTKRIDYRI